jgi:hypothetical protein
MLHNLPVAPDHDRVQRIYIEERDKIRTARHLLEFTRRWKPLFEMTKQFKSEDPKEQKAINTTLKTCQQLIKGTYKSAAVLACLKKIRKEKPCGHGPKGSCCAMHIALPAPLLEAFHLAEHYGCPIDMALVQANGGMGALGANQFTGDPGEE